MAIGVKNNYNYSAIFAIGSNNVSISFTDFPSLTTTSNDVDNAPAIAKETLGMYLCEMEQELKEFPNPSKISDIKTESGQILYMVEVWLPWYRNKIQNQIVKMAVEVPSWLKDQALERNVNCSAVFEKALKEYLHVGIGKQSTTITNMDEEVNLSIDNPNDLESLASIWDKILIQISSFLSSPSYETWLTPTKLVSVDTEKKILYIEVPNDFAKDWLESRYASLLTSTANTMLQDDFIIEFYTNR